MIKKILRKIIEIKAGLLAKMIIRKYKPLIVGITGSVGKTSTKEAIYTILKKKYKVGKSWGNLNTELGIPLAIAGYKESDTSAAFWLKAFWKMFCLYWKGKRKIRDILVLEMGADKPGDLEKLVKLVPPNVAVVTNVGISHLENFKTPGQIVIEKRKLVEALDPTGCAVLCGDDEKVLAMDKRTKARAISFGFKKCNLVRASNLVFHCGEESSSFDGLDWGVSFKLNYQDKIIPIRLKNILGIQQVYAVLAATACGIFLDMNLLEISEALAKYSPPPGRMKMLKGIKGSLILDDTYNSAPASALAALEVLEKTASSKRIAVLADMLELGAQENEGHFEVGKRASEAADLVFTFGERGSLIAKAASKNFTGKETGRIQHFKSRKKLIEKLQGLLDKNSVVLVKGSQKMRMEKVVKAIMAEPRKSKKLLVRQEAKWIG